MAEDNRFDERNLTKMGMNQRNIAALRQIQSVTDNSVFTLTETEKLIFDNPNEGNMQRLEKRLDRLEKLLMMVVDAPSDQQPAKCDSKVFYADDSDSRILKLEKRVSDLEKLVWLT